MQEASGKQAIVSFRRTKTGLTWNLSMGSRVLMEQG